MKEQIESVSIYLVRKTFRNYYSVVEGDYIVRIHDKAYKVSKMIDIDARKLEFDERSVVNTTKVDMRIVANCKMNIEQTEPFIYRTEECKQK